MRRAAELLNSRRVPLAQFAAVALAAHLVPLAAGGVGLAALPGRVMFAPLAARLSMAGVTTVVFAVRVEALLVLLVVPDVLGVWVFVALFGAANGMTTLVRASRVAQRSGGANYGSDVGSLHERGRRRIKRKGPSHGRHPHQVRP